MKEYRIILLSPAVAHSDLTSQATVQLDWTKSILGLTSPPNLNFEHIPATTIPHSASEAHQPSSSRLRGTFGGGIYQETGESSLRNSFVPPRRQTSSPFLPNKSRIHGDVDNGLGPGAALPQTPPRASTWSTPGDPQVPSATVQAKPISSNSTPGGRSAVGFNGISGISFEEPLHISRDNPRPTFDPFNDPDERYSIDEGRDTRTTRRMESETPSSESTSSSASTYSLVNHPVSTAPTSAEQEWKPAQAQSSSSGGGNIEIPGSEPSDEKAVQSDTRPIQTARVSSPPVNAPLPTATPAPTVTATVLPSIPFPKPRPSVKAPAVSPLISQTWGPLITTLRQNGGMDLYTALPPKLLKSNPKAYVLAGRSKYKPYIQLAVESGIVVERRGYPCPSIQLTAAYM